MTLEKEPISEKEFEKYKIKISASANKSLKTFIKKIADYCWELDSYAVVQDWGGEKEALIVFGVPPKIRKVKNAKNYFSIYKVLDPFDNRVKCEVCFPIDASRDNKLKRFDPENKLYISTINQCEGMFDSEDYEYVIKLINAVRDCRVKD